MTKKRKCYTILGKKSRRTYGAFERTKIGLEKAKKYKEKLAKESGIEFIIK